MNNPWLFAFFLKQLTETSDSRGLWDFPFFQTLGTGALRWQFKICSEQFSLFGPFPNNILPLLSCPLCCFLCEICIWEWDSLGETKDSVFINYNDWICQFWKVIFKSKAVSQRLCKWEIADYLRCFWTKHFRLILFSNNSSFKLDILSM